MKMKQLTKIFLGVIVCFMALCIGSTYAEAAGSFPSETNPFGTNYYVGATNQEEPFFESVLPEIAKNIKENNTHTISPYFDKLPKANNPENFQGLGSTSYANINGKTVTAEGFYRVRNDSLHDPNAGMGLLIYQCIQYKLAHPDEDVEIAFSTYRTSVTASVCVLPESKYYGYMRSLYTTNYDEHGFVRISYMFTEAARMGIKVLLINQLPSYAVDQYNPATGKLKSRTHLNFATYFSKALPTDCYEKYAPGKKVSDFMDYVKVGWTVKDQTANMQHVKACTVSHYLATDGTEHRNGVFFTTANLDENDYKGCNGNSWSQTGVIVTNHDYIYRVTLNYLKLMRKYSAKEGIQKLRKLVLKMNEQQTRLINSGKMNEIPENDQIIYLGTPNDPVFKLYYTPILGGVDTWDTKNNPICYHIDRLARSEDYIEFAWNEYGFENNYLGVTTAKMLEKAYTSNPNRNNKISIKVDDIRLDKIKALKTGTKIGYRSISSGKYMHAKDFLMSYKLKGTRHNVSIMTSCNYIMLAFHYRTNSILVIDETEQTGGNFYNIIGQKYSGGMIHKNGTHTFNPTHTKATLTANGKTVSKCSCGHYTADKVIYSPTSFKLSTSAYTYDGKVKAPTVTVKDSKGNTLMKDTDYTVSYEDGRINPGTYTVKITFKGKYDGVYRLYFTIAPKAVSTITATQTTSSITLSWGASVGVSGYRIYQYNSKTKAYDHIKSVTSGTSCKVSSLSSGTAYKFKVRPYKKDGETIWGAYSAVYETATKCATPKITKISSGSKGKATVTWSDVSGESGFQLYYSSKSDSGFKKVNSYKAGTLSASKTSLTSGKTYYFKVRAYKKTNNGTLYSAYSPVKSVKIK